MIKEVNIKGLKSQYFACSTGKIYRWNNGKMIEVKGWLEHSRKGYEKRYLRVKIGGRKYYKHRLILSVFDRWPEPGEVARHLNDDQFDNRYPENLAWGTQAENMKDKIKNKKLKEDEEKIDWLEQKKDLPF